MNKIDTQLFKDQLSNDPIVSHDSEGFPYSYYSSDEWVFWNLNITLRFSSLSGEFKAQTKKVCYNLTERGELNFSAGSASNLVSGATALQRCIIECGGNSYTFLNDDRNYRMVLAQAKSKNRKSGTWKNNIIFLTRLIRERIIDRDIGAAKEIVKSISTKGLCGNVTQTMCIPEKIADTYYSQALMFVEQYHPHRFDISETYKAYLAEYQRYSKIYKCTASINTHARRNMATLPTVVDIPLDYSGHWLSRLRGACYIVIAAFTGCRDGEIRSLNLSSYQEKKYAEMTISIVTGEHTKPNMGGVARKTSWVTIPSVKHAIELLWSSFQFARDHWRMQAKRITHNDEREMFQIKSENLFINLPHTKSVNPIPGRQAITNSLSSFIKYIKYSSTADDVKEFNLLNPTREGDLIIGQKLLPHPHSFRRTFAVYLVKNKLVSLLDIKYQFKHMNIAMTAWYANQANIASYFDMMIDTDLKSEISIETQNYVTDTFYYIYNEAETLAGPEGNRILDLRRAGSTSVYLSRNEIRDQVIQGRLSIVEHPGGYCTNPNCDRICDMTTCQHKIVTKEQALMMATVREKLIEKYTSLVYSNIDIPNIISKVYFEIMSIEKVLSEHNLKYTAFNKGDLDHG
jgi:integrase